MMHARAIRAAPASAPKATAPSAPIVQRKAKLGAENDPLEREADSVAAQVMAGASVLSLSRTNGQTAQRKCSHCEDEDHTVRRKCAACAAEELSIRRKGAGASAPQNVDTAASAVRGGGAPLSAAQRAYFEPRFGRDFSAVRLHTDATAQRAAQGIQARAYTYGASIAFAAGERSGATRNPLLAHELAHVAQQSGDVIRRQPAGVPVADFSGGGTTGFLDTVVGAPAAQPDGTITGQVRRQEFAPATATAPQQSISDSTINVMFDPNNCMVRLPFVMNFVAAATSGTAGICSNPAPGVPVPNVSAARLAEIGNEAVKETRDGLNNWFKLRISGCNNGCAGRDIPIRVEPTLSATNPDVTINVVNRSGRADAGTICAPDFNPGTTVHESGHQRLGVGDEYREQSAAVRAAVPQWARDERVRTDFTRMGSQHTYGRLSAFHERHFRFAQVFVQAALGAGCTVELMRDRMLPFEWRFSGGVGGASTNLGNSFAVEGGIGLAKPLDDNRRFNIEAGLHGLWLITPPEHRDALLVGARLGFSAQTHPASAGVGIGAFVGGGLQVKPSTAPYTEYGGSIRFSTGMAESRRLTFELEGALGKVYGDDKDKLNYARVGANLVFSL